MIYVEFAKIELLASKSKLSAVQTPYSAIAISMDYNRKESRAETFHVLVSISL